MSDRCYVRLQCHEKDRRLFEEAGFEMQDQDGDVCEMVDEEADYGNNSELREIAARGVPFFGFSDAGIEYGPAVFCGDGRKYLEVDTTESGHLLVLVDEDGDPIGTSVRDVKAFIAARRRAHRLIGADLAEEPE